MARNRKVDPIPAHFKGVADAGAFWDTHDLADYWDKTREVKGRVDVGRRVNVWLAERVSSTLQGK